MITGMQSQLLRQPRAVSRDDRPQTALGANQRKCWKRRATTDANRPDENLSLADIFKFESDADRTTPAPSSRDAAAPLSNAPRTTTAAPAREPRTFSYSSGRDDLFAGSSGSSSGSASTVPDWARAPVDNADQRGGLGAPDHAGPWDAAPLSPPALDFLSQAEPGTGSGDASTGGGWRLGSGAFSGPLPAMQPSAAQSSAWELAFAERPAAPGVLELRSQSSDDATAAAAVSELQLPLQSVMELTTAWQPPARTGAESAEQVAAASSAAGMVLPEGSGVLADGTKYERLSGEDYGPNGWWCRWTLIKGSTAGTQWEEKWWEVSDWTGTKELGASKSGSRADGSSWSETWREALVFDEASGAPVVQRNAHKRASDAVLATEWEEQWHEEYWAGGRVEKSADKWGKEGGAVWHEKWGEEYDGEGGCMKYTDKWAERMDESGAVGDKWGDKWHEAFKWGKGEKSGETWSIDASGNAYNKYWGEQHFGEGWVRKHGNSSGGESWDVTEQSGTHYNPVPHFGYSHALAHSPRLCTLETLPRDAPRGELDPGLSAL